MKEVFIKIRDWFRKYVSPVFLVMLLLSLMLWYLTKLGHTYTAKVPMTVELSGTKFKIECLAEGTGYRIVAHRFLRGKVISLDFGEVQTTPSVVSEGSYIINPYSLQNAISLRTKELRIISVGDLPEIKFGQP